MRCSLSSPDIVFGTNLEHASAGVRPELLQLVCYNRDKASRPAWPARCALQQRQGISTGLASSVSSSRTATLTRSRKATQTRTVRGTKHTWLDNQRWTRRRGTAQQRAEQPANEQTLQRPNWLASSVCRVATRNTPVSTLTACMISETSISIHALSRAVLCCFVRSVRLCCCSCAPPRRLCLLS